MKQGPLITLALVVGMLLGFTARGYLLSSENEPELVNKNNEVDTLSKKQVVASIPQLGSTTEKSSSPHERDAPLAETSFSDQVSLAVSHESVRKKLYELERVFASMTATDAPFIFAEVLSLENPRERASGLRVFFEEWGKIDGQAAFDMASELKGTERNAALQFALHGWAKSDVYAAWDVAVGIMENSSSNFYSAITTQGPIKEMAKQDPDKFLFFVSEQSTESHQLANMSRYYLEAAFETGKQEQYWQSLQQVSKPHNRNIMVESFFEKWGALDAEQPIEALALIDDDVEAEKAMQGFLRGWTSADPDAAFDYAIDNLDNPTVKKSIRQMLNRALHYGNADQNRALAERVQSANLDDNTLKDVVEIVSRTNPELALEMTSSITSEKDREKLQIRAIQNLAYSDFEAATSHYEQASSSKKVSIFNALNWHLMERVDGGERLRKMLRELPRGSERAQSIERALFSASHRKNRLSTSYREALLKVADSENLSQEAIDARDGLVNPSP